MWHDDTSFRSLWRRRSVLWFGSAAAVKAVGRAELRKLHQASERRVAAELGGALWTPSDRDRSTDHPCEQKTGDVRAS